MHVTLTMTAARLINPTYGIEPAKDITKTTHQTSHLTTFFVQDFLVKHFQKQVKDWDLMTKLKEHCFSMFAEYLNTISLNMPSLKMSATLQVMTTETLGE